MPTRPEGEARPPAAPARSQRVLARLQWACAATGIAGSLMLSVNAPWSPLAFAFFLISNAGWVVFGVATRAPGLTAQNVFHVGTSLVGLWCWLLRPA
jgi:hypothetical protein